MFYSNGKDIDFLTNLKFRLETNNYQWSMEQFHREIMFIKNP